MKREELLKLSNIELYEMAPKCKIERLNILISFLKIHTPYDNNLKVGEYNECI
jgi:hypothetical protein